MLQFRGSKGFKNEFDKKGWRHRKEGTYRLRSVLGRGSQTRPAGGPSLANFSSTASENVVPFGIPRRRSRQVHRALTFC
jgi:hypothetical protein